MSMPPESRPSHRAPWPRRRSGPSDNSTSEVTSPSAHSVVGEFEQRVRPHGQTLAEGRAERREVTRRAGRAKVVPTDRLKPLV
jgi:hypothetical protein